MFNFFLLFLASISTKSPVVILSFASVHRDVLKSYASQLFRELLETPETTINLFVEFFNSNNCDREILQEILKVYAKPKLNMEAQLNALCKAKAEDTFVNRFLTFAFGSQKLKELTKLVVKFELLEQNCDLSRKIREIFKNAIPVSCKTKKIIVLKK